MFYTPFDAELNELVLFLQEQKISSTGKYIFIEKTKMSKISNRPKCQNFLHSDRETNFLKFTFARSFEWTIAHPSTPPRTCCRVLLHFGAPLMLSINNNIYRIHAGLVAFVDGHNYRDVCLPGISDKWTIFKRRTFSLIFVESTDCRDSNVCSMTLSSAATTSTTMSVARAPRWRIARNAEWPGVSRKVTGSLPTSGNFTGKWGILIENK